MNSITISGGTKKKRELVESVACFMCKKLFPRFKTLQIEFLLSNLQKESGVCGFCNAFTTREFLVELDKKLDFYDIIETVCHEMIHVKQHARKELTNYCFKKNTVMWKNKSYSLDPELYLNFPWEKEAYEFEFTYAKEYLIYKGVWNECDKD